MEPRPVFLLHSHWNTDLGDKLLQIVGQPIINHCNFPGKTSHLHLMRRNVGGQLLILLRCLGMAAPEANPNTQCLRQLLHLPIIVVLLIQHQKDTVAGGNISPTASVPSKGQFLLFPGKPPPTARPMPAVAPITSPAVMTVSICITCEPMDTAVVLASSSYRPIIKRSAKPYRAYKKFVFAILYYKFYIYCRVNRE